MRYCKNYGLDQSILYTIPYYQGKYFKVDRFQIYDYNPLINARAHSVGENEKGQILNQGLKKTYRDFLTYLAFKVNYSAVDLTLLTSYFLLQDR